MIKILITENNEILLKEIDELKFDNIPELLWVDLISATEEEKANVEEVLNIKLQTKHEVLEIESSSRFSENDNEIIANSNFLVIKNNQYTSEPVSFILKNGILITQRRHEHNSFKDIYNKIKNNPRVKINGYQCFLALFERRIDLDADQIEIVSKNISFLSKKITKEKNTDENLVLTITDYQETTMLLREIIVDKQRVVSSLLRSEYFPSNHYEKLRVMIKDINSLLDHITFNFERLEFLQNTFLGLIDIEQNKIIKIYTVVSVLFLPPTLIASVYGMNFKVMPELNFEFGYVLAILLMIMSSTLTLLYFKRKKWL